MVVSSPGAAVFTTPHTLKKRHVAELLRVSTRTVERLVRRGALLPPMHLSPGDRSPRWLASDIAEFLNSKRD